MPPDHPFSPDPALPRYEQVKQMIRAEVAGHAGEARLLPSENELVRALGVSRMTVHRALRELADEGVVTRVPGVGTFSATAKSELSAIEVRDISEEIRSRGGLYEPLVHLLAEEKAGRLVAADLGLSAGAPVFRSIVVHRENGRPIQVEDRVVNPAAAPDYLRVDFTARTPHAYLSQVAPLTDAEHLIEAVRPDPQGAALLGVKADEPCLLVRRRTWSGPLVCSRASLLHPGSRYRIASRFSRRA